jgi:hypothetical protein
MMLLKAVTSSFYAGMMRKKEAIPPAHSPMTVSERQCCDRARKAVLLQAEESVDVLRYLSSEERAFIQHIKIAFQLNEDDLHLFHLVGYARYASEKELRSNLSLKQAEMPQPDFSPNCLSQLMECVKPTLASSRGYYAAMVHLKHHPVPMAWQAEKR